MIVWEMLRLTPQQIVCRPSGAEDLIGLKFLGLTPQANHMSPLRGSTEHVERLVQAGDLERR
jgi:hypothetical protein